VTNWRPREGCQVPAAFSGGIHKTAIELQVLPTADRQAVDRGAVNGPERQRSVTPGKLTGERDAPP
jgi:hypothetical protein